MATAKDLRVHPIGAAEANACIRDLHYSAKVVRNSQLHLGVFLGKSLEGVMQFGPSLDKRKTQRLVSDTPWNGFIELNRLAFSESLPRNSESRAIAFAMRIFRKHYQHIQWIVSFADATQSGDGAIYRASGFVLAGIKKNKQILQWGPRRVAKSSLDTNAYPKPGGKYYSNHLIATGEAHYLPGHQLRYVYFLDKSARQRLTVPELPFSAIAEAGAEMYKGEKITRRKQATARDHRDGEGAAPIPTLQV